MNEKIKYITAVLERTGVTISDLARIANISRTTLYRWTAGGPVRDMLRLDLAYTCCLRLDKAHKEKRLLFMTESMGVNKRVSLLRKAISHKG